VQANDSRSAYITADLTPNADSGPNRWGATTNADWLRMEADGFRAGGADIVVVETPSGLQALTYRCNIVKGDRVTYPKQLTR